MASVWQSLKNWSRPAAKSPGPPSDRQPPPSSPVNAPSPSTLTAPPVPPAGLSPPQSSGNVLDNTVTSDNMQSATPPLNRRPPFYFREENSNLVVKGNFMTLAAKPEHVEKGEWLAHQLVEQYRLLESMIKIVQEVDSRTHQPLCNPTNCPQMTAPGNTVYTWLDNKQKPIRIPASQYMALVQKWILNKIQDPKIFPVDTDFSAPTASSTYMSANSAAPSGASTPRAGQQPIPAGPTALTASLSKLSGQDRDWLGRSSGFPERFNDDIKALYRQMFRCYAHIYYAHWLEPFYHLDMVKQLNTCFIHFINVGRQFDLLAEKELAPMMPLVDIWMARELLAAPPSKTVPQSQTATPAQTPGVDQGNREVGATAA